MRNIACRKLKNELKHFSEFVKGIYETSDRDFFNLALIAVVFSIVKFIYFYVLLAIISDEL